jgi:hypothetical protein
VYVWVSQDAERPWYVGKAGKGLKTRCAQWTAGFQGTTSQRESATVKPDRKPATGLAMAARVRKRPSGSVKLWARAAGRISMLGQTGSLVSGEE